MPAGEPYDPARYDVAEISEAAAAVFVRTHHYSKSWPSTSHRYGLTDTYTDCLVGVLTLGVPMSNRVLTNPFPELAPNRESLELNRLVLLDEVPGNAESNFCARAFRLSAERGVRGLVAFSDPIPRWTVDVAGRRHLQKPGHLGIVYQALNFTALGRGTPRSLVLLPDATVLTARAMAKVTGQESGHQGVTSRLVELGASRPTTQQAPTTWLKEALEAVGATRMRHPGNYRYALRIGRTRAERTRTVIAMTPTAYPKG